MQSGIETNWSVCGGGGVRVCMLFKSSSLSLSRPRNAAEKRSGSLDVVECNQKRGELHIKHDVGEKTSTKTFTFDKVFGPNSSQIDVYCGVVDPLIQEVLMGYNCTVFA